MGCYVVWDNETFLILTLFRILILFNCSSKMRDSRVQLLKKLKHQKCKKTFTSLTQVMPKGINFLEVSRTPTYLGRHICSTCCCWSQQWTLWVSVNNSSKIWQSFHRSCVSLKSKKENLASYEDFRHHLSNNIVQYSLCEDSVEESGNKRNTAPSPPHNDSQSRKTEQNEDLQLSNQNASTSDIKILHSWTTDNFKKDGHVVNASDEQRTEDQTTSTNEVESQSEKKLHCFTICNYSCN